MPENWMDELEAEGRPKARNWMDELEEEGRPRRPSRPEPLSGEQQRWVKYLEKDEQLPVWAGSERAYQRRRARITGEPIPQSMRTPPKLTDLYQQWIVEPLMYGRRVAQQKLGLGDLPEATKKEKEVAGWAGLDPMKIVAMREAKKAGPIERGLMDPLTLATIPEVAGTLGARTAGQVTRALAKGLKEAPEAANLMAKVAGTLEKGSTPVKSMLRKAAPVGTLRAADQAKILKPGLSKEEMRIAAMPAEAPRPTMQMSMDIPIEEIARGQGVSSQEIARSMEKILRTRINTPLRGAAARGKMGRYSRYLRRGQVREVGDIETLAHEFGHGMEERLFGIRGAKDAWKPVSEELEAAGRALYPEADESAEFFAREGFAEYWWSRLTRNERTLGQFPQVHPWMENILAQNPKMTKEVTNLESLFNTYRSQGPRLRAFNQWEDFIDKGALRDPVMSRMQKAWLTVKKTQWNKLAFAEQMEKDVGIRARNGKLKVYGDESFVDTYKFLDRTAPGRAEWDVLHYQTDVWGNPIGPSARDILQRVRQQGHWDDFWKGYYYAKHTKASMQPAVRTAASGEQFIPAARETGLSMDDAQALIGFYESQPEFQYFKDVQPMMVNWFRNYVRQVAEHGGIAPELAERFFTANPEYMPLRRILPDVPDFPGAASMKVGNTYVPFKYRTGSRRPLKDPFSQIYDYSEQMNDTINRLALHQRLADFAEMQGAGPWITKVQPKNVPIKVNLDRFRAEIEEMLGVPIEKGDLDKIANIWGARRVTPNTEPTIFIIRDGKPVWYEVHPDLYKLLQETPRSSAAMRLLAGAARLQRLGATALRPSFALANTFRDLGNYMIWRDGAGTLKGLSSWTKGMKEAIGGGLGIAESDLLNWARATGIDISTYHGIDRAHRIGRSMLAKGKVAGVVTNPLDAIRGVLSTTEMGPRLAAGMEKAATLGWKPGAAMTPRQAVEIGNAIAESTVNFRMAGTWSGQINKVVPFYNPAVQGAVRWAGAFRHNPVRTTMRGLTYITLPTLGLWYINKDNPDYQDQPPWLKTNFWTIYYDKNQPPMRFPVPFENGIFKSIPEAIVNEAWKKDPEGFELSAIGQIAKEQAKVFMPLELSFDVSDPAAMVGKNLGNIGLIGPAVEVGVNRNWTGKPIVRRRDEDILPEAQANSFTTGIAKQLGETLGMSPAQIDHLVSGYTGGIGLDALQFASWGLRNMGIIPEKEKPDIAQDAANYFIVGRFFARRLSSSRSVEDMWQTYGLLTTKENTFKRKQNERAKNWMDYRLTAEETTNLTLLTDAVKQFRDAMDRRDAATTDAMKDAAEKRAIGVARRVMAQIKR